MSAPGRPYMGAGPVGIPRSPETFASRLLLHSVVQLRHQTGSQVAREVAGPSRKGRGVPWLTRGPRAGHRPRRGVPLGGHRPWDGGPLSGLGAPVPSRAFTPARRALRRWQGPVLPIVDGLERLRYSWGTLASMLSTLSASSKATPPFLRGG